MGKKMMHIGLEAGDVGRYVFLPGSPERTEKIAAYFDNPREIAYNREYRTFVGELDGTMVAVTSTGIGGPSAAIAVEELHQCGADTMMRVGTCASVSPKVSLGDVVIPNGAVPLPILKNRVHNASALFPVEALPNGTCFRFILAKKGRRPFTHRPSRKPSRWDRSFSISGPHMKKAGPPPPAWNAPHSLQWVRPWESGRPV